MEIIEATFACIEMMFIDNGYLPTLGKKYRDSAERKTWKISSHSSRLEWRVTRIRDQFETRKVAWYQI